MLAVLQRDGRISYAELARRVGLSAPSGGRAVASARTGRVITGYFVRIDAAKHGYGLVAFIRLAAYGSGYREDDVRDRVRIPEIMEMYHVVGEDCWIFKVAVSGVGRLEEILANMTEKGRTTTSIVLSSPDTGNALARRPKTEADPSTVGREPEAAGRGPQPRRVCPSRPARSRRGVRALSVSAFRAGHRFVPGNHRNAVVRAAHLAPRQRASLVRTPTPPARYSGRTLSSRRAN